MTAGGVREGLTLLRRPNFAKLFAAYLITYTGSTMAPIAIAFGVLEVTGSTSTAAYVIAGQATVPLLIALMLNNGSAVAFHAPSSVGFIPQVVAAHELQSANSLLGTARSSAITIGAALAGVLVATVGPGVTLALDAASFALAAWLIGSLKVRDQAKTEHATILEDLRLGWHEFIAHQWLWIIVVQFAVLVAGVEAVFSLIGPATARDVLGGPRDWGFIMACFGGGAIVGGLWMMRIHVERPMWVASWLVFLSAPLIRSRLRVLEMLYMVFRLKRLPESFRAWWKRWRNTRVQFDDETILS